MKKGNVLDTTFDSYTIVNQLGEGGAGRVFEVTDGSGKTLAAKIIKESNTSSDSQKRFKNEVTFCLETDHPNVIKVRDHGVYRQRDGGKLPFYLMGLFPASLRSVLNGTVGPYDTLSIFFKILDGVEAAHLKGVVHRDLKPENVLLDQKQDRLVVADFGIARFVQEDLYTAVETKNQKRLANFVYAAPEQRSRKVAVDARADIYALGLILNEMFTGMLPRPPHGGEHGK